MPKVTPHPRARGPVPQTPAAVIQKKKPAAAMRKPEQDHSAQLNMFNYKSFKAKTFEELDNLVKTWLREQHKRLLCISCWFDGQYHYAMLSTNVMQAVLCDARGVALAVKDNRLWVDST